MKLKLVKDKEYPEMHRIKFQDGELSDMYNLTRAKHHLRVLRERDRQSASGRVYAEARTART